MPISIGGEIGEVGKENSTPEELRAYMNGYRNRIGDLAGSRRSRSRPARRTAASSGRTARSQRVAIDFSDARADLEGRARGVRDGRRGPARRVDAAAGALRPVSRTTTAPRSTSRPSSRTWSTTTRRFPAAPARRRALGLREPRRPEEAGRDARASSSTRTASRRSARSRSSFWNLPGRDARRDRRERSRRSSAFSSRSSAIARHAGASSTATSSPSTCSTPRRPPARGGYVRDDEAGIDRGDGDWTSARRSGATGSASSPVSDPPACPTMTGRRQDEAGAGPERRRRSATFPSRTPGQAEVLIRVLATAVCGSDKHIYQWDPSMAGDGPAAADLRTRVLRRDRRVRARRQAAAPLGGAVRLGGDARDVRALPPLPHRPAAHLREHADPRRPRRRLLRAVRRRARVQRRAARPRRRARPGRRVSRRARQRGPHDPGRGPLGQVRRRPRATGRSARCAPRSRASPARRTSRSPRSTRRPRRTPARWATEPRALERHGHRPHAHEGSGREPPRGDRRRRRRRARALGRRGLRSISAWPARPARRPCSRCSASPGRRPSRSATTPTTSSSRA